MLKQKPRLEPKLFVDPFTGGPTAIPAGRQLPLPVADGLASQAIQLAEAKQSAAQLARAAALSLLAANGSIPRNWRPSDPDQTRKLGDQIAALLTAADAETADTSPAGRAFASAVRKLRELIPLVPPSALSRCIEQPPDFAPALKHALELFRDGILNEPALKRTAAGIAQSTGLPLNPDVALETAVAQLIQRLPAGGAAPWIALIPGVEARPYHDDSQARVYKLTPINQALSTVGGWEEEGQIHLAPPGVSDAHPLLDADGGMPLFDRVIINNSVCGHAVTDIVGLIGGDRTGDTRQHGKWLVVQKFLPADPGQLAEARRVYDWANEHGHAPLPPQADQPELGAGAMPRKVAGDATIVPVLVKVGGKFHLGLDINTRNALVVGGRVISFDTVWREVPAAAFKTNPQLRRAREQIEAHNFKKTG